MAAIWGLVGVIFMQLANINPLFGSPVAVGAENGAATRRGISAQKVRLPVFAGYILRDFSKRARKAVGISLPNSLAVLFLAREINRVQTWQRFRVWWRVFRSTLRKPAYLIFGLPHDDE